MATADEIPKDLGEMTWSEIQTVVAQIRAALGRAQDAETKRMLHRRLTEAREAIARIEDQWDEHGPVDDDRTTDAVAPAATEEDEEPKSGSIDELLSELLADETGPASPDPAIVEASITTAPRRRPSRTADGSRRPIEERRLAEDTDRADTDKGTVDRGRSVERSRTGFGVVLAFTIASGLGIVGILAVSSGDQPEETASTTSLPGEPTPDLVELEEILAIIGLDELEIEQDGSIIRISGTVASSDRFEMVRDAAKILTSGADLDISGVVVTGRVLGIGESSGGSDAVEPKLQRDLDRLLRSTPLMFDPGQSELSELDRRILNAIVALIRSAPDTELTIVGYADQDGANRGDADLAAARAEAVLDYLVARGVRQELLTAEAGDGSPEASGTTGPIELRVAPERVDP